MRRICLLQPFVSLTTLKQIAFYALRALPSAMHSFLSSIVFLVFLDHSYCALETPSPASLPSPVASNPVLSKGLAAAALLIDQSIQPSTARKYESSYIRWSSFCVSAGVPEFPAAPDHIAACLATVASETLSVSAVEGVYAAISHAHRRRNLPSPTSAPAIALLMRSVRRRFQKPRCPAKPLRMEVLRAFLRHLFQPSHGEDGLRYDLFMNRSEKFVSVSHLSFFHLVSAAFTLTAPFSGDETGPNVLCAPAIFIKLCVGSSTEGINLANLVPLPASLILTAV